MKNLKSITIKASDAAQRSAEKMTALRLALESQIQESGIPGVYVPIPLWDSCPVINADMESKADQAAKQLKKLKEEPMAYEAVMRGEQLSYEYWLMVSR